MLISAAMRSYVGRRCSWLRALRCSAKSSLQLQDGAACGAPGENLGGASALQPGLSLSMTSLLSTGAPAASSAAMLPATHYKKSWAQVGSHLLTHGSLDLEHAQHVNSVCTRGMMVIWYVAMPRGQAVWALNSTWTVNALWVLTVSPTGSLAHQVHLHEPLTAQPAQALLLWWHLSPWWGPGCCPALWQLGSTPHPHRQGRWRSSGYPGLQNPCQALQPSMTGLCAFWQTLHQPEHLLIQIWAGFQGAAPRELCTKHPAVGLRHTGSAPLRFCTPQVQLALHPH